MGVFLLLLPAALSLLALGAHFLRAGSPLLVAVRLTIILGSVALLTVLSSLGFRAARVRRWYGVGHD